MPAPLPPTEHRFSSTNQPKTNLNRKGTKYFKPLLKKLLNDKIEFDDPILKQKTEGKIGRVIAIRHLLNALQGEHASIKDIMDRVDDENVPKDKTTNHLNITNIRYEWNTNNNNPVQPAELSTGDSRQSEAVQGR